MDSGCLTSDDQDRLLKLGDTTANQLSFSRHIYSLSGSISLISANLHMYTFLFSFFKPNFQCLIVIITITNSIIVTSMVFVLFIFSRFAEVI